MPFMNTGMYRKGRLSVHHKNEFRKKRALSESVVPLTLPKSVFVEAPVSSMDHLKSHLKEAKFLPQGFFFLFFLLMHIIMYRVG